MIINKLSDNVFFTFASKTIGEDVLLYHDDLILERSKKEVKLHFYVGGEMEDERKFLFQDGKCMYLNCVFQEKIKDISFEWVQHIVKNNQELTREEKQDIINIYNQNIEQEIVNYINQKKELLMSESI